MNGILFMYVTNSINLFLGMTSDEASCLADSATTHTIFREQHYFTKFIPKNAHLTTLLGSSNLIKGYRKTRIMFFNGTELIILEIFEIINIILKPLKIMVLNFFVSVFTNIARNIFTRSWNIFRVHCTSQPFEP